jgi:Flp pilus assembly pilin Flp
MTDRQDETPTDCPLFRGPETETNRYSVKGNEMKLFKMKNFAKDESGAVTVDWVVLTAAIVGIAIAVVAVIKSGVDATATEISNALTAQLT